jgi:DNA-binding PadR family transcriptional regulator
VAETLHPSDVAAPCFTARCRSRTGAKCGSPERSALAKLGGTMCAVRVGMGSNDKGPPCWYLVLGLLRDGMPRHGYRLISEYGTRSGLQVNPGSVYREIAKLVSQGLIEPQSSPPDGDRRRIPYRITTRGRDEFDRWLLEPQSEQTKLEFWILVADLLPPDDRGRHLERLHERLWLLNKNLIQARGNLLRTRRCDAASGYQPAALLLMRRAKRIALDIDFLEELRRELQRLESDVVVSGSDATSVRSQQDHGAIR